MLGLCLAISRSFVLLQKALYFIDQREDFLRVAFFQGGDHTALAIFLGSVGSIGGYGPNFNSVSGLSKRRLLKDPDITQNLSVTAKCRFSGAIWNAAISEYITRVKASFRVSLICLFALVGAAIGQQSSYRYDTVGITLHGTLIQRKVYGSPGYGETPAQDAHDTILILKLPHPISVKPAANAEANGSPNLDPAKNVRDVQLHMNRPQAIHARRLLGRKVTAIGTLNESITAVQRTKVWMEVKSLNSLR